MSSDPSLYRKPGQAGFLPGNPGRPVGSRNTTTVVINRTFAQTFIDLQREVPAKDEEPFDLKSWAKRNLSEFYKLVGARFLTPDLLLQLIESESAEQDEKEGKTEEAISTLLTPEQRATMLLQVLAKARSARVRADHLEKLALAMAPPPPADEGHDAGGE